MKSSSKILVLTRYPEQGASSRLRIIQYLPYLRGDNISYSLSPFFNNKYLKDLYANKKLNFFNLLFLYFKRFTIFFSIKRYDLIWIEKEVFPYLPSMFESLITLVNVKYVVDYDDAIFHNYDSFYPRLYKNKFNRFLSNSSLVVVCNDYLSEFANNCGAQNIIQIPTVVDIKIYEQKQYINDNEEFRIGWIGSPSTTKYLYALRETLLKINEKHKIKLVIIGGSELYNFDIPIELHKWSINTENDILKSCDVGIMPLNKSKWEEGKCGFKLIQYMASGLPVIASCVGFNRKIVDEKIGFLASNEDDWSLAFEYFLNNRSQIMIYGNHARKKAEKYYALQDWSNIILKNINFLLDKS